MQQLAWLAGKDLGLEPMAPSLSSLLIPLLVQDPEVIQCVCSTQSSGCPVAVIMLMSRAWGACYHAETFLMQMAQEACSTPGLAQAPVGVSYQMELGEPPYPISCIAVRPNPS